MSKVKMPREEITYNVPALEAVKGSIATMLTGIQYAMVAAVATKDARLVALLQEAADLSVEGHPARAGTMRRTGARRLPGQSGPTPHPLPMKLLRTRRSE